jgi:signal transduction histidine kinase/response regulator of citrate/malate metabolism
MEQYILVVDTDPHTCCEMLASSAMGREYHLISSETCPDGMHKFTDLGPSIVLINTEMPGGTELLREIRSCDPEVQIMAISKAENADQVMKELKDLAGEFLTCPLNPTALEIALKRSETLLRMRCELKKSAESKELDVWEKAARQLETERFLTVRQMVDNISLVIAQTAKQVQGGVRYFNELPYFVSIHGRDCKVLATNPTYKKYLGNQIYRNSWDIYSRSHASRHACPVGRTLNTEGVLTTRAVVRYLSGARVPVIVHTAPIFNDDGEVELVLEVFVGTKEIDRLSDEIKTTQQRYQQLFDAVPSYIAVLDRKLRIAGANRRFKDDFGDHTSQAFFDIFRPAGFQYKNTPIHQTLNDGMPHHSEMVLISRTGIQYNIIAWTSPIKTAAGKLIQVLVIFLDVTELRRLQDNLSSLGLMIGTLSHNLKGVLTGLDAGLYLIDSGFYRDTPARIEEGLEVSRLMADRIRKMVHNILYYAKERELETEEADAAGFVRDTAATIETRIRGADIEFQCEVSDDMGMFDIDSGLLRSAIINLLENAMEACIEDTEEKPHYIRFTGRREGNEVIFEISDNAMGMDRESLKQIFNLFYSSKGRKGTGLGMFITKNVIQKHSGTISVNSEQGKGTQFHIRLPGKPSDG